MKKPTQGGARAPKNVKRKPCISTGLVACQAAHMRAWIANGYSGTAAAIEALDPDLRSDTAPTDLVDALRVLMRTQTEAADQAERDWHDSVMAIADTMHMLYRAAAQAERRAAADRLAQAVQVLIASAAPDPVIAKPPSDADLDAVHTVPVALDADKADRINWTYRGRRHVSRIVATCPLCGARAVIKLPADLLAEQPDDTTHVCHTLSGGCNRGFTPFSFSSELAPKS